jgi:protoporphyrinogen oxidase
MKKVIIIGAGPAGLTAAYELLKDNGFKQYQVVILEASNAIGGISKTVKYHDNRMDIGGHRFFTKDQNVLKFWTSIMPLQGKGAYDDNILGTKKTFSKDGPDPETTANVFLIRNRVSRIYYNKKFFNYPITLSKETLHNLGFKTIIKAGFSYLKVLIIKRKENSLEDFYINHFGKVLYNIFFEKYTEKLWGRHPREIASTWGAQRVKGISIKAVLKDALNSKRGKKNSANTETSLIEEFWYPKYGPGELWELLAQKIVTLGGTIKKIVKLKS